MNANTALKLNAAVHQAVECGEVEHEIRACFEAALRRAFIAEQERVIQRAQDRIVQLSNA